MTEPTRDLSAALAQAIWDQPEAAFRTDAPAETPDEVFATTPRERPAPIGGHRYHVQGHDESLRDVRGAADRARRAGATQREVIDFLVLGYRGLVLPGADERRLGAILGAIWADADDQREEAS